MGWPVLTDEQQIDADVFQDALDETVEAKGGPEEAVWVPLR